MNDKEEAKRAYDKLAETYHNKRIKGKDFNELIEQPASFSFLGNISKKMVLDAGCGTGIYSKILAKKGAKVYGLEISENMIKLAKNHCKNHKIEFKQGSIDKIPYKKEYFDFVLASLVIHYLKRPERAFKEFNRVLKKDGILVFSTQHPVFEACKEIKSINGKKIIISDYFKKGKFYWKLHDSKVNIPSYKIGFEELANILYKEGFIIEKLKEASLKKQKNLPKHLKKFIEVPSFIVMRCRKIK